jgi:hypothetical protein
MRHTSSHDGKHTIRAGVDEYDKAWTEVGTETYTALKAADNALLKVVKETYVGDPDDIKYIQYLEPRIDTGWAWHRKREKDILGKDVTSRGRKM